MQSGLGGLKKIFIRETKRETIAAFATLVYLLFQIYRTFIYPLPPLLLRPVNIAFVILLVYLYNPVDPAKSSKLKVNLNRIVDGAVFISIPLIIVYHITNYQRLITRLNYLDPIFMTDRLVSTALVVFLLCGIWRIIGRPLAIFISIFIVYGFVSPYLPGILYYQGLNFDKFTSLLIMGSEGLYGSASSAASGFLFWIMMFGSIFSGGSGGQVLIDIGLKAGSKSKDNSAPAKAAVISSCLFGMISGSAAGNVAATGVFTIPMMKEVGYTPEEAGAIEAVASTGGQIMPPIMGAAAFLMADLLEINYLTVATSALPSALIYYGAVFLLVQLLAKSRIATGDQMYTPVETDKILPRLYMLAPVVVMMGALGLGSTLQRSALYAILSCIVVNFLSPKRHRRSVLELFDLIITSTKRTSSVAMPLVGCGIIVGIISMTGLSSRMSVVITSLGAQNQWVGLLITMVGCLLLGMALPTLASYLTAYVLFIPTLRAIGIAALPANLFIFYYGIFAQITPPVCIASYTAAGISGAKPWNTGWKAFTYAACAYLAPFVFVYQPGVLLQGTFLEIVSAIFILVAGTAMLTIGIARFLLFPLATWERILFCISGILICIPETISDRVGFVLAILLIVRHLIKYRSIKKVQQVAT